MITSELGLFPVTFATTVATPSPWTVAAAESGSVASSAGGLLTGFGLLGYSMARLDFRGAPLILGFVLGDGMERALRQSLQMSGGELGILVSRPIAAVLLGCAALVLLMPLVGRFNRWRLRSIAENG